MLLVAQAVKSNVPLADAIRLSVDDGLQKPNMFEQSLLQLAAKLEKGDDPNTAYEKACGQYGRVDDAVKIIDPRTDEVLK